MKGSHLINRELTDRQILVSYFAESWDSSHLTSLACD